MQLDQIENESHIIQLRTEISNKTKLVDPPIINIIFTQKNLDCFLLCSFLFPIIFLMPFSSPSCYIVGT